MGSVRTIKLDKYHAHAVEVFGEALVPPLDHFRCTVQPVMTSLGGRCHYKWRQLSDGSFDCRYHITLSGAWLDALKATPGVPREAVLGVLEDTLYHELAHAIAVYQCMILPRKFDIDPDHGPEWKRIASALGATPSPYMWEGHSTRTKVPGTDVTWSTVIANKRTWYDNLK